MGSLAAATLCVTGVNRHGRTMIRSSPVLKPGRKLSVLCLGAHPDDIEIGCGGTLLAWQAAASPLDVRWVVFSGNEARRREAAKSARSLLARCVREEIRLLDFRESYFPEQWGQIKRSFEEIRSGFEPDVIFTHYRDDRHQDHRVLSDLAWNTFRDHLILEYEIPKYDGDLGVPNLFVPLRRADCNRKVQIILRTFKTQAAKHWFTQDLFRGLMRIRGMECAAKSGLAEAFHCRKLVLG